LGRGLQTSDSPSMFSTQVCNHGWLHSNSQQLVCASCCDHVQRIHTSAYCRHRACQGCLDRRLVGCSADLPPVGAGVGFENATGAIGTQQGALLYCTSAPSRILVHPNSQRHVHRPQSRPPNNYRHLHPHKQLTSRPRSDLVICQPMAGVSHGAQTPGAHDGAKTARTQSDRTVAVGDARRYLCGTGGHFPLATAALRKPRQKQSKQW